MDVLMKAIMAAGKELGNEHEWMFDGGTDKPGMEDCFVRVLIKHVSPLISPEFKAARIAALRAEADMLERHNVIYKTNS